MAGLKKQTVSVPFVSGMITKVDEKQQSVGSFRLIKNAVFDKIGKLKKRFGYDYVSSKTTSDTDITTSKVLSKFQNELLLFDNTNLYSYINTLKKWSNKSTAFTIHSETQQIIKNNKAQSNLDSAYLNGLNCFVYEDSDGVHLSIVDSQSEGFVISKNTLSASGTNPKIRVRNGEAYCTYIRQTSTISSATAILDLTSDITLTSVAGGTARNTTTFTLQVEASAANPTDTVLADFTGTAAAIVCTITPNDGTNNGSTPVDLTTEELVELINTGAVSGKTVTITDSSSLRGLQTATGGDATDLADGGEGDGEVSTFSGGTDTIKKLFYKKFLDFNDIGNETEIVDDLNITNIHYDITLTGSNLTIAYNNDLNQLSFIQINSSDILGSIINLTSENPANGLNVTSDSNENMLCSYATTTDVKFVSYDSRLNVKKITETSIETIGNAKNMTAVETSTGTYTVLYEITAGSTYNHYIKKNTITTAAAVGTAEILLRSVGLASKPFTYNGSYYFTIIHDNTLQSTYFISDTDGKLFSKIFPSTGGDVISAGGLPQVDSISSTKFLMAQQSKGRLVEDNGTFFSLLGVSAIYLDLQPSNEYKSIELSKNLHIAGGLLKSYDGSDLVEHGFHLYPEGLANGGTSTSGGALPDGTYDYKAVYAWTDAQGVIHRSAPSEALSVTLSGGGSTQQQTVNIPTLRLTDKTNAIIELYRTEDSGTVFYKVTSVSSPTFNDKTSDTVSIVDNATTDAQLINNEILYTTGGVLENIAPPSSSIVFTYKDRVCLMTPSGNRMNYSKTVSEGFPVEFSDNLQLPVPRTEGGKNVAAIQMDDKIIYFKELSIQYTSGDGPNNLGEQDSFIKPELIISGLGCKSADSVLLTPKGVIFQSNKGMYLLDRGLNLQYIGEELEEFNPLTVSSAEMVSGKNQVRFTTSDGDCFVYNYHLDKWGLFGNHKALSAKVIGSSYYYIRTDNIIYKESEGFSDYGSPNTFEFETAWISFAGVQNFQRVYRMLLEGTFKSPHKLQIQVAYNGINSWVESEIIDTSDFIEDKKYGDDSPYGESDTYYGGDGDEYTIRLDFARQKCKSIKIRIVELQDSAGEGLDISNMLFIVGTKAMANQVDNVNTFGVS